MLRDRAARASLFVVVLASCGSADGERASGAAPPGDAGASDGARADAARPGDAGDGGDRDDAGDAGAGGSTVHGEVVFADGGAGKTSVLLARASDFSPDAFYDALPSGPKAFDVTGPFSLGDVPAGTYWVLAGFANDGFVPKPPSSPPEIVVSGGPDDVVAVEAQTLVAAIAIVDLRPKATSASVTIRDVEGEDAYHVEVIDFLGNEIYAKDEPASSNVTNVTFAIGAGLTVPIHYRVRVTAMKNGAPSTQTEDLAGTFVAAPDDT